MQCDAMRCDGAVRCGAVRCGAVRCDAMRCDAMRCDAVRCGAMRCGAMRRGAARRGAMQRLAHVGLADLEVERHGAARGERGDREAEEARGEVGDRQRVPREVEVAQVGVDVHADREAWNGQSSTHDAAMRHEAWFGSRDGPVDGITREPSVCSSRPSLPGLACGAREACSRGEEEKEQQQQRRRRRRWRQEVEGGKVRVR